MGGASGDITKRRVDVERVGGNAAAHLPLAAIEQVGRDERL
jgi:hypothetical protein